MSQTQHVHRQTQAKSGSRAPFWVRHYDRVVNLVTLGRTGKVHRGTLSLVNLQPGYAVLDIGCGTGMLLLEAEKVIGAEGTAVGLDVEPEMIRQARGRATKKGSRAAFDVASIDHIPYADNSFDVALSTLMYHHLTEPQKAVGMVELARVLKPGGRLLLVDMNTGRRSILTALHGQGDRRDFVRGEAAEQMEAAGLTIIASGDHPSRQLAYVIGKK